ncbi:MAG: hypothetical protein ACFFE2_07590 [Candidatus Thorarchaeota archaeon]
MISDEPGDYYYAPSRHTQLLLRIGAFGALGNAVYYSWYFQMVTTGVGLIYWSYTVNEIVFTILHISLAMGLIGILLKYNSGIPLAFLTAAVFLIPTVQDVLDLYFEIYVNLAIGFAAFTIVALVLLLFIRNRVKSIRLLSLFTIVMVASRIGPYFLREALFEIFPTTGGSFLYMTILIGPYWAFLSVFYLLGFALFRWESIDEQTSWR